MAQSLFQPGGSAGGVTANAVISSRPCEVHEIVINSASAAATVQLFDDTTTTTPANQIGGTWTPGALTVPTVVALDIMTSKGFTILITGTINVTPIGRFSA